MFNLNLIKEPGIQRKNSDAIWSYLHKRKVRNDETSQEKIVLESKKKGTSFKNYIMGISIVVVFIGFILFLKPSEIVSTDMVLNQVIDLIIESGYVKDIQLTEAHFMSQNVKVTITSDKLSQIQAFTNGFRKEDNIPFKIFHKSNMNYITLDFPWNGGKEGGDIKALKNIASKTVFSNKISINYSDKQFELRGRSSDIISYLLQMADEGLLLKFNLSVYHLESGNFFLEVLTEKI